ncbi:hypothetical protein SCMU_09100 [Sinomonas cyclohexanicum]|uniref:Uncharacterized protein n=1 Tax=Sinomonas cyclohexanicum TaxID=322009 RepID=A0ABM7PS72_SINCY|nr:hypothetical protein [Corynebacterium cyclohexanicum]BCT75068.1 hypothetical protein SCMU_09100 [Corynebacterium cyclohexanicum]
MSASVLEPRTARRAAPSGPSEAALKVEGLWKIFGPKSDRIIGTPDEQLTRKELQRKTGCLAAVKDVSFEVAPVRSSW